MFLKLAGGDAESNVKKHTREIDVLGYRNRTRHANHGPNGVPVSADEGRLHHFSIAERERLAVKRVSLFALEVATGVAVGAGTILAIFAWTGASL
jgi:hypothetical protein